MTSTIPTDKELVILALKNKNDFCHIINKYQKLLAVYIRRLTSVRDEDIEDILQEIFIKVYQNLNEFDESLKFSSWIYRIAHNEVISHYRYYKNRPRVLANDNFENIFDSIKDNVDLEKTVNAELINQQVQQIINDIDIKYREIIILRYFEEKDYEEIADILKKPKGTVATLLNRARKQLADKYIKKYGK